MRALSKGEKSTFLSKQISLLTVTDIRVERDFRSSHKGLHSQRHC